MNEHYLKVTEYFNKKADKYDDVDNQLYWVLSDSFYREVLKKELRDFLSDKKELKLLDAGAGTGRWTMILHELFDNSSLNLSGTLIDISEDMLKVASRKISDKNLAELYTTMVGDIENMDEVNNDYYDLAISFYNVLSFVQTPEKAVAEIAKKLKPGGMHISVVGNTYHALYFSILTGRTEEINRIKQESKISFNDQMPAMHCFKPNELVDIYLKNGFSKVYVKGGPNFIYPGMEETFVTGQTESLVSKLEKETIFKEILDIEIDMYDNTDIVGRGNTLIVFAKK
jgi:ubiquinone/menaquinone biosynthesis C-methylase UbiE